MVYELGLLIDIRNCLRLIIDKTTSMANDDVAAGYIRNLAELAERKAKQLYDDEYDRQVDDGR